MNLILASASPRRKEILTNAGYTFTIVPSNVDEDVIAFDAIGKVDAIAAKKCDEVFNKQSREDVVVLSADTIVCINGEILEKPKNKEDAYRMISLLQGKSHYVYTAVYIKSKKETDHFVEKTEVVVSEMTNDEIEEYISTSEPYDKAGAYAIQGIFSKYISEVNGDYYNVMGLPINKVSKILNKYSYTSEEECVSCKKIIKANQKFCPYCGAKQEKKEDNQCHICNFFNDDGDEFCRNCGSRLEKIEVIKDNIKNNEGYSRKSLIFGIISICLSALCFSIYVIPFSIVSIVLGIKGIKSKEQVKSHIGIGLSIVALLIAIISIIKIIDEFDFLTFLIYNI